MRSTFPGDAPEDSTAHQTRGTGIIEIEQPAEHFTRGEQSRDGMVAGIQYLGIVTLSPPKVKVIPHVTA